MKRGHVWEKKASRATCLRFRPPLRRRRSGRGAGPRYPLGPPLMLSPVALPRPGPLIGSPALTPLADPSGRGGTYKSAEVPSKVVVHDLGGLGGDRVHRSHHLSTGIEQHCGDRPTTRGRAARGQRTSRATAGRRISHLDAISVAFPRAVPSRDGREQYSRVRDARHRHPRSEVGFIHRSAELSTEGGPPTIGQ